MFIKYPQNVLNSIKNKGDKLKNKIRGDMAEYIKKIIPKNGEVNFILKEDFNRDDMEEVIVGYVVSDNFIPYQVVLYVYQEKEDFKHVEFLSTKEGSSYEGLGVYDSAYVADTTGDGKYEFILGLTVGNGHYVTPLIFNFVDGKPKLLWKSDKSFYHGKVDVFDEDRDGIYEIIVEGSTDYGSEIVWQCEACPHARESEIYKYNGKNYISSPYTVWGEHLAYNTAIKFLVSLWEKDYKSAYDIALLPNFLGLQGINDSSIDAFSKYVDKEIMPVLTKNLKEQPLEVEYISEDFCHFEGKEDYFIIELIRDKGVLKVFSIKTIKSKD